MGGSVANTPDRAGGYYSSQNDMMRMGQSILSPKLLTPNTVRQWMKPVTFTSSITAAVGMPWEIWRVPNLTDHVFDLYTKVGPGDQPPAKTKPADMSLGRRRPWLQ